MSKFTKALEQANLDRRRKIAPAEAVAARQVASGAELAIPWSTEEPVPAARTETIDLATLEETLTMLTDPSAPAAEQYRTLRNSIERAAPKGKPFLVAVSSPAAGDGKSVTSINLTAALAQAKDRRVLLIETDLRAPSLARKLGVSSSATRGLSDAIRDPSLSLGDVTRFFPQGGLWVVLAGPIDPNPYESLRSTRLADLLEHARRTFDYVILDTPPLFPISDCRLIEQIIDGMVIVVSAHQTQRNVLEEALRVTDLEKVLGIVFNSSDPSPGYAYYKYYPRAGG